MAKKVFTDESLETLIDETKSYVDSAVSKKANSSHTHSISNITNLQSTLDGKVPTSRTVNGKALSSNITLSASDVGAASSSHTHSSYVNQNAFSNVKVGDTTISADITTDTLNLVAGSNVTITPDATNDKITISAKDTTYNLGSFGITATASELNKLDGVTATTAELNYVGGVTSNIQTQLDGKSSTSHTHDDYMTTANPVGTGSFSMNRLEGSTVGNYSYAVGLNCEAIGEKSSAEGHITIASGTCSHAEGYNTNATGIHSHAEGSTTKATGGRSHAEGNHTTASGESSHAEGYYTTALEYQHAQGHYNNTTNAKEGNSTGTNSGTAFVIGNGTSSAGSNAFRVTYDGKPYARSNFATTGCDYAEYFEWKDLNPNNEDRRGYFVTLDGDMIKIAEPNDYILGIISGMPSMIGNGDEDWMGRYVFDEFGAFVYEEFEYQEEEFDKKTGETKTVIKTGTKYKENPDYDPSIPYIQREDRPEWDAVGMIGVLSVRDDGTCKVNGYCTVTEGGIATYSETGYRVIKRVTDNIVKVVFR